VTSENLDLLIHRWFEKTISPGEEALLWDAVRTDPAAADRFVEMSEVESGLLEALKAEEEMPKEILRPSLRARLLPWPLVTAAAALVAVLTAAVLSIRPVPEIRRDPTSSPVASARKPEIVRESENPPAPAPIDPKTELPEMVPVPAKTDVVTIEPTESKDSVATAESVETNVVVLKTEEGASIDLPGGKIVGTDEKQPVIRVASDMSCVAAVVLEPNGMFSVGLNGKKGNEYSRILAPRDASLQGALCFSKNYTRFGYVAEGPKGKYVVIDQKESGPYDLVMDGMPLFSPDSSKVAYVMVAKGKLYLALDEARIAVRDIQVGSLAWSPDSGQLAYCAQEGNGWNVVVREIGGKNPLPGVRIHRAFKGISKDGVIFSADSSRVGYAASASGNKWFVFVDGQQVNTAPYNAIAEGSFTFSRDSSHYAYAASVRGAWHVFLDGKPCAVGKNFVPAQAVAEGTPRFSGDSNRLVYAIENQKAWSVILHDLEPAGTSHRGTEIVRGQDILPGTPGFGLSGRTCVYAAQKPGGWYVGGVRSDGKECGPYEGIRRRSLLVSPDGSRTVFVATRRGRQTVVVDGKEGEHLYDKVGRPQISREEGSNTVVVAASRDKAWVVLVNGEEKHGWYQGILADETEDQTTSDATAVSPDGRKVSFYAALDGKWSLWVDGVPLACDVPYTYSFDPATNLLQGLLWNPESPTIFQRFRETRGGGQKPVPKPKGP
jgi:Tol biopolymer transport system component